MITLIICLYLVVCSGIVSCSNANTEDYYWRDYFEDCIPNDAFNAAPEVFIGQVNHGGNLPATLYPNKHEAITTYNGKVNVTDPTIKVFCTKNPENFYWDYIDFDVDSSNQMHNAVVGGYQLNVKEHLYIGKAFHEGEWKVGRVVRIDFGADKGLWVWNSAGEQVGIKQFHLLKYKSCGCNRRSDNLIVN